MGRPTLELGRKKTGGRVKGTPNKVTTDSRQMILAALDKVGGINYLTRQAEENPTAFLSLVGRTLPKEINATIDTSFTVILGDIAD